MKASTSTPPPCPENQHTVPPVPPTPEPTSKPLLKSPLRLLSLSALFLIICFMGMGTFFKLGAASENGRMNRDLYQFSMWCENTFNQFKYQVDLLGYQFTAKPPTEVRYVEVEKEVPVPYPVKEYVYVPTPSRETAYVWVHNLRMRYSPYLSSETVAMIPEGEYVNILEGPTSHTSQVELRGIDYDEPWYKVETPDGEIGWVFGGGLDLDDEY